MGLYYIGAFPPSYGGVTIKNRNLYDAVSRRIPINRIDLNRIKRKDVYEALRLMGSIIGRKNRFIIGISSGDNTRRRFTKLLYCLNRKAMNRSIIVVMGGTAAREIEGDKDYQKWVSEYKKIYVETEGMRKTLLNVGIKNAETYPNGRFRPKVPIQIHENNGGFKCIFFSLIQPEKGADLVLKAAAALPDVEFALFGEVTAEYRDDFLLEINRLPNASYCGIFKGSYEELYTILGQYDALLFPTKWKTEGVPGILVEAKIAGITSIVSNESYNAELVNDRIDGIVLVNNTATALINAIKELECDRRLLQALKKSSMISADQYYIENYIDNIIGSITC